MAGTPSTAMILPSPRGPRIGGVQVNASISETHRRAADITKHAVEVGADVADHRRVKQFELQMDGVISGAPITPAEVEAYKVSGDDAQDRYNDLLLLFETSQPFDVVTGLAVYSDMVFETFDVTREAKTGKAIHFTALLVQLIFADSERATLPQKKRTTKLGAKATTGAPGKTSEAVLESTASKLLGGLEGARDLRTLGQ